MKKRKDGKIVASLTEVKNKTGDIFQLVDEYGEVTLTSYNKERYRIVKIGIENFIDLKEEMPKKNTKKKSEQENKSGITLNIKPWKRDNRKEKGYSKNIQKPLR